MLSFMILAKIVMPEEVTKSTLLIFATLVLGTTSPAAAFCVRGESWWDRALNSCVPCTVCDPTKHLAVKVPCELHRDTVCQSVYSLDIWSFTYQQPINKKNVTKNFKPQNISVPSKIEELSNIYNIDDSEEYYVDYLAEHDVIIKESDSFVNWNLQTCTLALGAFGCFIFFIVVFALFIHHSRQWRILKLALKSDVQDLSAKLRLMEAGPELPTEQPVAASDHHIYCNIHVNKDNTIGTVAGGKGFGNVYTQDKH